MVTDDYAEAIAAACATPDTELDTWLTNGTGAPTPDLTIERVLEAQRKLAAIPPLWVEDPLVPLDGPTIDGPRRPVLCWRIGDTFHVHPERMAKFRELLDGLAPFGPKEALVVRLPSIPWTLEGGDWRKYAGATPHTRDYDGFVAMWRGIAWVRLQGFERAWDAEEEARDHEGNY